MNKIVTEKRCSKCRKIKSAGEFGKDRKRKDKLTLWCKSCQSAYYQSKKESIIARVLKYQKENKDKVNAKNKKWETENSDRHKENRRRMYANNKEKFNQRNKSWRERNPIKQLIYKTNRRARENSRQGKISADDWKRLLEKYGHKCLRCGRTNVKLTMDHVIPLSKGGLHDISNIQPLCLSCNCSKGREAIDYR